MSDCERTILVHLNITPPAWDDRTADEIKDAVLAAYEVGRHDESVFDLKVSCPLSEEI